MDQIQGCTEQKKASSSSPLPGADELKKNGDLRKAITDIDSMCQVQLGQIETIVSTTLRAMETQRFWQDPLQLRELLGLIEYLCCDLGTYVNSVAEQTGCNHIDDDDRERERRILDAFRATREPEVSNV